MILFWTIVLTICGTLFATGSVIGYRFMKKHDPDGILVFPGLFLVALGLIGSVGIGFVLLPPGGFMLGLGYGSFIRKRLAAHSE